MSGKLLSNEFVPYVIRLPNRVQVALSFRGRDVFEQHAIQKDKSRDAHVGGAMYEDGAVIEGIHDSTESAEILRGRCLEIYRDVNVRHPEVSNNAAFVCEGIVGSREGEVNDGFETSFTELTKLFLAGLAGSGEFVAKRAEVVDVGERYGIHALRPELTTKLRLLPVTREA